MTWNYECASLGEEQAGGVIALGWPRRDTAWTSLPPGKLGVSGVKAVLLGLTLGLFKRFDRMFELFDFTGLLFSSLRGEFGSPLS